MLRGVAAAPLLAGAEQKQRIRRVTDGSLGARLQGVQHFGLTLQDMERAFAFYTDVLGGSEIMRDGDFQGERIHNTLLTGHEIEARRRGGRKVRMCRVRTRTIWIALPGPERFFG